jgi:hypothetical protein
MMKLPGGPDIISKGAATTTALTDAASIQPGAESGLCILRLDEMEKGKEVLDAI